MFPVPLHVVGAAGGAAGTLVGNPLYDMDVAHGMAVAAVALLPVVFWLARTRGGTRVMRVATGYDTLPPIHRFAFWLLAITAAAHLGLALSHGTVGLRLLFLVDGILLAESARRLALGRPWRALAAVLLLGSIVAYWAALLGGEAPDQVGLATKLVEVTALAIVLRPSDARHRLRGWAASGTTVGLVVATALTAWIGAFAAAGGVAAHTHDHGSGAVPGPGTLMPVSADVDEATPEQVVAAEALHQATAAAIARYADPAVAAADGYDVAGLAGLDFHAANEAYDHDGLILDPARPETLVYAQGPHGPVLLGAMFKMPAFGEAGPAVGGPLTVWHGHEGICFSLVPPGLTGIVSPLGGCPVGSLAIPRTVEMMHVWTAPGAPQPFGDLDDAWRRDYVNPALE